MPKVSQYQCQHKKIQFLFIFLLTTTCLTTYKGNKLQQDFPNRFLYHLIKKYPTERNTQTANPGLGGGGGSAGGGRDK